ncbi:MAG TPA: diaminopimelate decarboxylase [Syntrophorhabdaceae bacterium]|nr:diaminopimelate decarboxylase [Syntrophorhabdaceae bacterium]HQM80885.1 diaminopimelate decarboxylase [Syntrophorhabdaceae bacterium]
MHFFEHKRGELHCEKVPVAEIAAAVGTPCYVYSYRTLERHFYVFNNAFRKIPHITCYSCKANANSAILRMIARFGGGADIVSGGELYRALRAGIPANSIVFSGVGKTEEELRSAIKAGILMINIESEGELQAVTELARTLKKVVPVSIRVNPEIDPKTHPYITTGLRKNKFGVLWNDARRLYKAIRKERLLVPVGISSHIGSQILELSPFVDAVRSLKSMIRQLHDDGTSVQMVDIGGGLGITYKDELPPHPEDFALVMERELEGTGLTLVLEPGRVLVGNSGIFVTKLLYIKTMPGKTFYIVDGAMNDLVRPALYDAYHEIIPVKEGEGDAVTVDVVGPVCESGDFIAKGRTIESLKKGDLLAVLGAGAYGFSMSSNYNARRRVAEVLVKDKEFYIIRKRESFRDLVRNESVPHFLEV